MLREISSAGDRGRTGALDVEWEGARATLFFMFGHPSHVVYETANGRQLAGEPALDAFVAELPEDFRVAPWRRAMVTDDTLHFTAEDLMGLFQRRNAAVDSNGQEAEPPAPAPVAPPPPETPEPQEAAAPVLTATATTEQPPFGLRDFPLLPVSTTLWTDAAANVIGLEAAVPRLPDSMIVLGGPTCLGVALIAAGRVTDAVWVNAAGGSIGEPAAHAVMNSLEGTLTAFRADDPQVMAALPMLWRGPRLAAGLPGAWLHTEDVVAEVRTSGRSCCLVVDSADPGVALFASGELVAVYTAGQRWPATSMAALRGLLHEPGALITVIGGHDATADPPDTPAAIAPDATLPGAGAEEAAAVVPGEDSDHVVASAGLSADATASEAPAEASTAVAAVVEPEAAEEAAPDTSVAVAPEPAAEEVTHDTPVAVAAEPAAQPRARWRRGKSKPELDVVEAVRPDPTDAVAPGSDEVTPAEPHGNGVAASAHQDEDAPSTAPEVSEGGESIVVLPTEGEPAADEFTYATTAPSPTDALHFEPAMFTIADLTPDQAAPDPEPPAGVDPSGMAGVEAREATEFVPARLDIDVDALRAELTGIATVWLGEEDAAPVAHAIGAARPGVDDFVSTIRAIGAMQIPGHESSVVRAMAREMHFRASEVLCGV